MLDARLRRLIDPPLDRLSVPLAAHGLSANAITVVGFALGLGAAAAIAGAPTCSDSRCCCSTGCATAWTAPSPAAAA